MCKKGYAVNKFNRAAKNFFASASGNIFCFIYAFILILSLMIYPVQGWSEETLIVNITVNSISKGDFFVIRDEKGDFFIKREDFPVLGIKLPENTVAVAIETVPHVALNSLPGFKIAFDEKKLSLSITSPVESLPKTAIDLSSRQRSYQNVYHPGENSFFLNYALNYSYSDYSYDNPERPNQFMVINKFGARSGDFFFINDTQYTKNESTSGFLRLMSYLTYERPQNLQWITLGDIFATSGALGSTINIGGLGISKIYKMDPYLIRQPTLDFSGAAALPSQVDVYVDGVLTGRQKVQPGQFEIKNLNYYGGMRNVELVIRDAFGVEQRFEYSVYFARTLLKHQLHEYSYNVGWLREQYGIKSDEYSKPAFSAFHRYGATDWLTIGAGGEAADDIYNGSIHSTFLIPFSAGVITAEIAGSKSPSNTGWAGSVSHSFQKRKFGSSAFLTKYSSDYATIGNISSSSRPDYVAGVEASYSTDKWGSFSLGYSQQEAYEGVDRKATSAHYFYNLTRSLTLGVIMQAIKMDTADTDYQFTINLNYHSPKGVRAYTQYQSTHDGNNERIQISKDQPAGEGWGGNIVAIRDERKSSETIDIINPRLQYNGRYGTYTLDSYFQDSENARQNIHNISAAGSVVYAGGFFGLTRPVNDSFGFVAVDKLPDVPVSVNNQEIGKTDRSGILIIPTLHSYNINNIDLKTADIPMDYQISETSRKIYPSVWSGSCIFLEAQKLTAVTGTVFIQKEGRKIPLEYADISIKIGEKKFSYPTGKGGEFYIENILPEVPQAGKVDKYSCHAIAKQIKSGGNRILPGIYGAVAEYEGGKCEFSLTFPETNEAITDLGAINCVGPQTTAPSSAVPSTSAPVKSVPAPTPPTEVPT